MCNTNNIFFPAVIFVSIFVTAIFYIIGVYMAYGLFLLEYPEYNYTTGCPIGKSLCSPKMPCYKNNMYGCYLLGGPVGTLFGTIIVGIIMCATFIIVDNNLCINHKKDKIGATDATSTEDEMTDLILRTNNGHIEHSL